MRLSNRKYEDARPVRSSEQMCIDALRFQVLQACHWNRTRAAWHLGISVRGLRLWIKEMERFGYLFPSLQKGAPMPDEQRLMAIFADHQDSEIWIYET
jgi:hypothetical protein